MGAVSKRRARLRVRPNVGPLVEAEIVALVRSVESLFASEQCVGACIYRQDPLARVLVKKRAERVRDVFIGVDHE
jgi:hypothetical protein